MTVRTVFIDLDSYDARPLSSEQTTRAIENAIALATKIRPKQEKELDQLLTDDWQVVSSGVIITDRDRDKVIRMAFILYKRGDQI